MTKDELMETGNQAPEVEMFGFDDDQNVKIITLEQLEDSVRVEGKHNRVLQSRPIQSWNAIAYIKELLIENNVNYTMGIIYVQKRNSFPMLNDAEKDLGYNRKACPVNRWMFDKIMMSFNLPNIGDELVTGRIGFSFNDDGIEIAFGMHVDVCQNFNILGGQIMRTFKHNGEDALSWASIEILLKEWISNLDQKMKVEMDLMLAMQEEPITDPDIISTIIGGLYVKAINQAYGSKETAPFDTAGMSQFVQAIIKAPADGINNVWDLYNYGTRIIKPEYMDIADIQSSSANFAKFLIEKFEIKAE